MSFEGLKREELVSLLNELLEKRADVDQALRAESEDQARLLHELQVHQVELEMQNRELREAQIALEQSRDRYAELYDFAPVAYVTLDEHYAILALNVKAAALLGEPREGLIGRSFLKLVRRAGTEPCIDLFARARASTLGVETELSLSTAGENRSVQLLVDAGVDPATGSYAYRCAMVDVTERARAERERDRAHAAEQVLHRRFELLDQVNVALSTLLATPDRVRLDAVVDAVAELALATFDAIEVELKLETDEPLLVQRRREPRTEETQARALQVPVKLGTRSMGAVTIALEGGDARALRDAKLTLELLADRLALALENVRLNRKEAEERASLSLLEEVARALSNCHDTASTEEALAHSAQALVPAFGSASLLYLHEASGYRTIAVSHQDPQAERLLARLSQPSVERLLSHLHEGATYASVSLSELASGFRLARELQVGRVLVLPLATREVRHGLLALGRTSTAAPSPTLLEMLERFAQSCAWALDRARLLDQLRTAVESRDTLLAIVSHDLRSPLNAILLTARSLASVPPERERRRSGAQVALIQRSVARMGSLIEDLLTANAIDADQLRLEPRAEPAAELVQEACQLNEPQAEVAGLKLVQQVADNLPKVRADRQRMLQVLTDLLGNAIKFTPRGGLLTVRAEPCNEGVRFAVSDTGPGIAAHQRARVFDRYWSGKARRNGLGLGLFICQRLIAAQGGRIWVESAEGAGATFLFTLPFAEATTQVSAVSASPVQAHPNNLASSRSEN